MVCLGQALRNIISDADTKIQDFVDVFRKLKESFNTATTVQVVYFTSQILEDTRKLCKYHPCNYPIPVVVFILCVHLLQPLQIP